MIDAPIPALTANMLIDQINGLSPRIHGCLRNEDLRTVAQVAQTPDAALLRLPNFGRVSLRELRAVIPYWTEIIVRDDRCESCRFWDGRCHRRAPRIDGNEPFPRTSPGDWCGEWERRSRAEPSHD